MNLGSQGSSPLFREEKLFLDSAAQQAAKPLAEVTLGHPVMPHSDLAKSEDVCAHMPRLEDHAGHA